MKRRKIYKKNTSKPLTAKEPLAKYGKNRMRFYKSFEDANEADYKSMAELTPLQRMEHVTMLVTQIFAKELQEKMDLTIHFK